MLYPNVQEAPVDSASADSAALDAQLDSAQADTVGVMEDVAAEIGEVGGLLIQGEWATVYDRASAAVVNTTVAFVPKVLLAAFVGVVLLVVYRVLDRVARRFLDRTSRVEPGLKDLFMKGFRLAAWAFIAIMILAQLGINVTALVAGLGIAGIALGFAAKDTLENLISGITILLDRPFRVGDMIEVEGIYGCVMELTLRSTRVKTPDNRIMVMPNLLMISQRLINHSALGVLRVDVPFGIAYKEDIDRTREVVSALVQGDDRLADDHPPQVVVTELNSSSVDMQLRFWARDPNDEKPLCLDYLERVRKALGEADIEIPFPHLQLFIDEAKAFENGNGMSGPASRSDASGTRRPEADDARVPVQAAAAAEDDPNGW